MHVVADDSVNTLKNGLGVRVTYYYRPSMRIHAFVVGQDTTIVSRTLLQATSNILLLNNNSAPLIYSDAVGTRPDHLLAAAWLLQI